MLQYLIIHLDDTSVSYCHYDNKTEQNLISLNNLKAGILFAMKENLMIQMVYPDYQLPEEYEATIETIDHVKIKPFSLSTDANVVVIDSWNNLESLKTKKEIAYVLRTDKASFFENYAKLLPVLDEVSRLNVVIKDIESFTDDDFAQYKTILGEIASKIKDCYEKDHAVQLNLLTDRMMLDKMNNCNAGWESITLAPDGRFYVCPAFYLADEYEDFGLGKAKYSVGDLKNGIDIKNPQLYRLDHAPLCRKCDAYQCRRCVWLNRKTTYEVNTPSHEQCVMAHIERHTSRDLLASIRTLGTFLPDKEIKEIDYLDPFEVKDEY